MSFHMESNQYLLQFFSAQGEGLDQVVEFDSIAAFDASHYAHYFRFSTEYPSYPVNFKKWHTFSYPGKAVS